MFRKPLRFKKIKRFPANSSAEPATTMPKQTNTTNNLLLKGKERKNGKVPSVRLKFRYLPIQRK